MVLPGSLAQDTAVNVTRQFSGIDSGRPSVNLQRTRGKHFVPCLDQKFVVVVDKGFVRDWLVRVEGGGVDGHG